MTLLRHGETTEKMMDEKELRDAHDQALHIAMKVAYVAAMVL